MSSSPSSSSPSCPKKMITLKSSDGEIFEIDEIAALQSKTLENMIDEKCAATPIPLPNINGEILAKVVEFCTKHAEVGVDAESLRAWDAEFVNVEHSTVFDYILAANFLEIPALLDLACEVVADMIKGKTPDEIRKFFNIKPTISPEEEEEAANFLEIPTLLDLACQSVADMIKGKTPSEIRKTFNINCAFSPEEEEEVRRENQWAFE